MSNNTIQECIFFKSEGGYFGGGRGRKFYTDDEFKDGTFGNGVPSADSLQLYNETSRGGYSSQNYFPFAFGYTPSYLSQADCRELEKQFVGESIKSNFSREERRDKALVDKCAYAGKKVMDLEALDLKDNLPHKILELDGFLHYDSPLTNKKFKVSDCRYIEAELLVSNNLDGKRIVHIQGENKGSKDFYISEDLFHSDDKLFEKMAQAGIHIKYTKRNKAELLNEIRIYLSGLFEENIRAIPHHAYWNYLPDGTVWFAAPGSESEELITNPSGNKASEKESPWELVKSDPFVYLKLIILVALNRVSYLLTKLLNHPQKWILLLVDEGQKKAAAALFRGARFITESMGIKDVGHLLTSTYSGFAIYLYKSGSKTSTDKLNLIDEMVDDGFWNGKPLTTIPLVISESSIPEGLSNYFTIVENSQLSDVKLDDLILDSEGMTELIKEFPTLCDKEKIATDFGFLYFAGLYAARCLNSDRFLQHDIKKIVDEILESDESQDGFLSCSTDFINAIFKHVEDASVSLYHLKTVPAEFDPENDLLFDDSYVFISKRCFSRVVAGYSSDIGINSLKKALLGDNLIVPYGGSTYTAKPSVYISGNKKNLTMIRLQREKLRDSLRRPDIVDFKKLKGGMHNEQNN